MRVAVISHTYVTQMSQEKIQAMANAGMEILLIVPEKVKDTLRTIHYSPLSNARFETVALKSYFDYHNSFRLYHNSNLKWALQRFKPDIVLAEQEPYSLSTWQISRLKSKLKFKLVTFSFQNIYKKYPWPFSQIEKSVLKATDFFIAGCESVKPVWIQKGFPEQRIRVLPQVGVSLNEFAPQGEPTHKESFHYYDRLVIGYAGRFVEEKGVQILLEAFAHCSVKREALLLLVGRGPYRDELERKISELNISSSVHFLEGISHEQMPKVLNAMDVLVLPSLIRSHWREQFGHILIEAMACEVPCIGSDIDPINQVIGEGGWIFQEGDSKALCRIFEEIAENPQLLETKGRSARNRVAKHYTNEVIAKELLQIFQNVLRS